MNGYINLIVFILTTLLYFYKIKPEINYDTCDEPPSVRSLGIYALVILITQFILNVSAIVEKCGGSASQNIGIAALFTFLPWTLIFGIMLAVLIVLPGFKSAFSDVIGYFYISGKAHELFSEMLAIDGDLAKTIQMAPDDKQANLNAAANALIKMCGNMGILINQIVPSNFKDYWKLLNPLMKPDALLKQQPLYTAYLASQKEPDADTANASASRPTIGGRRSVSELHGRRLKRGGGPTEEELRKVAAAAAAVVAAAESKKIGAPVSAVPTSSVPEIVPTSSVSTSSVSTSSAPEIVPDPLPASNSAAPAAPASNSAAPAAPASNSAPLPAPAVPEIVPTSSVSTSSASEIVPASNSDAAPAPAPAPEAVTLDANGQGLDNGSESDLYNPILITTPKNKADPLSVSEFYKTELLKLVVLRENVGEFMWYLYTGILVISIIQYYILSRGCFSDAATMEKNYQKFLEDEDAAQAQKDAAQNTTYTIS